jgi:hypothetical protein
MAVGSAAFLVETCRQLGEELVRAWRVHGGRPPLPLDETEDLFAMRLVAQRCLYGVDRNPMAVDLAKLSMWLVTLAKDHPFTFLDHAIRCGDSLVGLTRRQIERFHWADVAQRAVVQQAFGQDFVGQRLAAATQGRREILEGGDWLLPAAKREKLDAADRNLDLVRFAGDLVIAAYFNADKDKARQELRDQYLERLNTYLAKGDLAARPTEVVSELRSGAFPVTPFHWEIEFPEVFDRENSGFDAFVGNPPFAGKNTLINGNREGYVDWLKALHAESHGNADLVAHFFRRAFVLLRPAGCFGLIATNTIAQGDTRTSGLRWICTHDGIIYAACKRLKWPGEAAVVVSVVHVGKSDEVRSPAFGRSRSGVRPSGGPDRGPAEAGTPDLHPPGVPPSGGLSLFPPYSLDGRPVERITAYLFHAGGHDNPAVLQANVGKGFIGSYVLGMGFTFDDTDSKGVASPLALMRELIAKDPRNAERIFPYIGGEEVNDSPTHAHHRYVINFGDMSEDEARRWSNLMTIVEEKVRPARLNQGSIVNPARWWMFARPASDLYAAARGLGQVLVLSRVRATAFTFLRQPTIFSEQLVVFPFESLSAFCLLQSLAHEIWSRFFSGTALDLVRYAPADCFETFPFPRNWETDAALVTTGQEYYEFRAALMRDLWIGLTQTYNLFHDPEMEERLRALYGKRGSRVGGEGLDWRAAEKVPADQPTLVLYPTPAAAAAGIVRLRELHTAMDRAVLHAYGWDDIPTACEFILDYDDEDPAASDDSAAPSDAPSTPGRRKKRPWRYRWPDPVRDEVLARLLALNAERAEEERLAGAAADSAKPKGKGRGKKVGGDGSNQPGLGL